MKLRDSGVALMGHIVKQRKNFILQVDKGKFSLTFIRLLRVIITPSK